MVRTRAGDFVADNLYPSVRPWYATPYRWVRIETPENPMYWSTVEADPTSIDERSLASGPAKNSDDMLVAADATEIAAADQARDATDVILRLRSPTQTLCFRRRSRVGLFSLAGPTAVMSATPTPAIAPADERLDADVAGERPVVAAATTDPAAIALDGRSESDLAPDPFGYGSLISMN